MAISTALLSLANSAATHAFGVYRPFYYVYKTVSDRARIARMKAFVRPGMVVLDIGANIGFYTRLAARLVGAGGCVHSFEPDPANFVRLRAAAAGLAQVRLNPCAVADTSRTVLLYRSEKLNVDHRTYDSGDGRTGVAVSACSIDDYLCHGEVVDCIKIDVQGFDVYAARGMRRTVGRSPRVLLVGELWPYGLNRAGSSVREFVAVLRGMGFSSSAFDDGAVRAQSSRERDESYYTDFTAAKGSCA